MAAHSPRITARKATGGGRRDPAESLITQAIIKPLGMTWQLQSLAPLTVNFKHVNAGFTHSYCPFSSLSRPWATIQPTPEAPLQIQEANRASRNDSEISQVTEIKDLGPSWALVGFAVLWDSIQ